MPGTARPRPASELVGTGLPHAGQRGTGEEAESIERTPGPMRGFCTCPAWSQQNLPVLVDRFPLFDERRHAFRAILQRECRMKKVAFDFQSFRQRRLEG